MSRYKLKSNMNTRQLTTAGILSALTIVLNYTPLAFMLIPGFQVQITLMHVPVIIGAILEGPKVGAFIGFIFGIFSIYTALITPLPIAFAFLNPIVSVLPRIMIGVTTYFVYKLLSDLFKQKNEAVSIGVAAAVGTLTNTIGVLSMIYILYAHRFIEALGIVNLAPYVVIFGLALPNAPIELAAAVLITIPVVIAVKRIKH